MPPGSMHVISGEFDMGWSLLTAAGEVDNRAVCLPQNGYTGSMPVNREDCAARAQRARGEGRGPRGLRSTRSSRQDFGRPGCTKPHFQGRAVPLRRTLFFACLRSRHGFGINRGSSMALEAAYGCGASMIHGSPCNKHKMDM